MGTINNILTIYRCSDGIVENLRCINMWCRFMAIADKTNRLAKKMAVVDCRKKCSSSGVDGVTTVELLMVALGDCVVAAIKPLTISVIIGSGEGEMLNDVIDPFKVAFDIVEAGMIDIVT